MLLEHYEIMNYLRSTYLKEQLPNFGTVHQELKRKGVTLMLLWYEYQQQNPGGYSYRKGSESIR